MKVSVSLPDEDIEFLDAYAHEQGMASRSAAVHKAVRLLRAVELADDYEAAWAAWRDSGDAELWTAADLDGLGR